MTLAVYQGELSKFELDAPNDEPIDRAERDRLLQECGSGHWTKLSMDKLRAQSRPSSRSKKATGASCSRSTDSCTATPNLIVHDSFLSLGGALASASENGITYDVGVSTRLIPQALFITFFSYLTSLVLQGAAQGELAQLWH